MLIIGQKARKGKGQEEEISGCKLGSRSALSLAAGCMWLQALCPILSGIADVGKRDLAFLWFSVIMEGNSRTRKAGRAARLSTADGPVARGVVQRRIPRGSKDARKKVDGPQ